MPRLRTIGITGAVAACVAALGFSSAPQNPAPAPARPPNDAELRELYNELSNRVETLTRTVNLQSRFNPPVGTVVAFAGIWDPGQEDRLGWMLCDGRSLPAGPDYDDARAVLPDGKLPNLCGVFLRGLDRDIVGKPTGRDKGPRRVAGQSQKQSTAKPEEKPFSYDSVNKKLAKINYIGAGSRFYGLVGIARDHGSWEAVGTKGYGYAFIDIAETQKIDTLIEIQVPDLPITGGDDETRPMNVAVNWLVKVRSRMNPGSTPDGGAR
jgi:hypothetical protein